MPSTTPAITKRYYPRLSEIASLDDMPASLSFLQNGINAIFNKIHYKNFQYTKSPNGDTAFYSLDIVSSKKLSLSLPGGIGLVLNRDATDANISAFPVSLEYQWGILGFINGINLKTFKFTPKEFFDLGLKVFKLTDSQLLAHVLNNFVTPANNNTNSYQQLVNDINSKFNTAIIPPPNDNEDITSFVTRVKKQGNFNDTLGFVLFQLYILGSSEQTTKNNIEKFYEIIVPGGIENYLRELITPKIKAKFQLSAGIEFPRNILKPVSVTNNIYSVIPESPIGSGSPKVVLKFGEADFYADSETGLGYSMNMALSTNVPAQIGNTGIIVAIQNLKIDLSNTTNIAEADADGRPADFMGVYIQDAMILLPDSWTPGNGSAIIKGKNLLIGTGGISGTIALVGNGTANSFAEFTLGKFTIRFSKFDMNFHMNRIIGSSIEAQLGIPKPGDDAAAKTWIKVKASFNENGDFTVTASGLNEKISNCFGVFDLTLERIGLVKINNKYGIEVGGQLDFALEGSSTLKDKFPKGIEVSKLIIWEDGRIDLVGGGFTLNKSLHFELGPITLDLNNLSFGLDGRYGIFGFDGTLDTGDAGVAVKGNGIKLYFAMSGDPDIYLRIDGIGVNIRIPGDASEEDADILIKGFLNVSNTGSQDKQGSPEYTGGIALSIKKANIQGSATMRMAPAIPSFIIDAGIELALPIPLASTGLGVYGFRGLIGGNYHVSKTAAGLNEDDPWWLYYKSKNPNPPGTEGVNIGKFSGYDGFNLGAGASIATLGDEGVAFSSKLFFMLGVPSLFLLQGQATFLSERMGIASTDDPPFSAFLAISEKSIEAGIGVNYQIPKSGDTKGSILDLNAKMELAFFFNNASGWYINFGKDQPESERVRATILSIFEGHSYLMLSAQGIKAGAGVKFDWNQSFGPVAVGFGAHLNIGGKLSFSPIQIGGFIDLGGYAYAKVFGFGFNFTIGAMLAAEAPKPFNIVGGFSLKIGLPWPFDDININVNLDLIRSDEKDRTKIDLINPNQNPSKAINMLTGESFDVKILPTKPTNPVNTLGNDYIIPLDSYIDLEFSNVPKLNIADLTVNNVKIGGNTEKVISSKNVPPEKSFSKQDLHEFEINEVSVKYWDSSLNQWRPYNVWEQLFTNDDLTALGLTLNRLKELPLAYWQNTEPGAGKLNKLRILGQNQFSYMQSAHPGQIKLEFWDYDLSKTYCAESTSLLQNTINWVEDSVYHNDFYKKDILNSVDENVSIKPIGKDATVEEMDANGFVSPDNEPLVHAATFESLDGFEIYFKKKLNKFNIKFEVERTDLNALRYTKVYFEMYDKQKTGVDSKGNSIYSYVLINANNLSFNLQNNQSFMLFYNQLDSSFNLTFDHATLTVDKIVIKAINQTNGAYYLETGKITIGNGTHANGVTGDSFKGIIKDLKMYQDLATESGSNYNYNSEIGSWPLNKEGTGTANGNFSIVNTLSHEMLRDEATMILNLSSPQANSYVLNLNAALTTGPNTPTVNSSGGGLIFNSSWKYAQVPAPNNVIMGAFWNYPGFNMYFNHKYGFSGNFKTDNTDLDKRVIVDRTGYYMHNYTQGGNNYNTPANIVNFTTWQCGFEVYLLNKKLHIAIKYDKVYTYSYDAVELTNNQWYFFRFDYDPLIRRLTVKLGASASTAAIIFNQIIPDVFDFNLKKTKKIKLQQISYVVKETQLDLINEVVPTASKMLMEANDLNDGLNKSIQPIWRPNTIFAIDIVGKHLINGSYPDGPNTPQKNSILFQTKGPIGHFHEFNKTNGTGKDLHPKFSDLTIAKQRTKDEFRLLNLRDYIDYERSYPNADGNLVNAKPMYFKNPKINLLYVKAYLKLFYKQWLKLSNSDTNIEYPMVIEIVDPVTNLVIPSTMDWKVGSSNSQEPGIEILNNIKRNVGFDCNSSVIQNVNRKSFELEYNFTQNLQPERMYQVNIFAKESPTSNAPRVKIHQFVFYTSKFESFNKHIQSYYLPSSKGAKFLIENDFSESWTKLTSIINNTETEQLKVDYPDKFERAIQYGLKQLGDLIKPEILEVNIIKSTTGSDVKKLILIKSAESFFDPKVPFQYIKDNNIIEFNVSGLDYYISKDRANIFIYNNSLNITENTIAVTIYNPTYGSSGQYIKGAGETITIDMSEESSVNP